MLSERLQHSAAMIRERSALEPHLALVLGSGLGDLAERIEGVSVPYSEIPGFPRSTAPGHKGALHIGRLFGIPVIAMQGRVHMYEGYSPADVVFPIQVMAHLGAKTLVLTNAAGGLDPDMKVGDLMVIEDHFSLAVASGFDPLRGSNDETLGPRFVSMNKAYDPGLVNLAQSVEPGLFKGVYGHVVGPSFEPPALVRFLRACGCDAVGMSTVPEVIAARHMGQRVFALSAITNLAVHSVDDEHITEEAEVWEAVRALRPKLLSFFERFLPLAVSGQ